VSPRLLVTVVVIILIIALGLVFVVKRAGPMHRKGDPNNEPPVTQPAPRK
jgi:hypothetical protein